MSIQKNNSNGKAQETHTTPQQNGDRDRVHTTILILLLFLLTNLSAFALGKLSASSDTEKGLKIETVPPDLLSNSSARALPKPSNTPHNQDKATSDEPFLVGSKNSDKYHFAWCSGAKRINEDNLVSFASYEEARNAGYVPAQNCEGLE